MTAGDKRPALQIVLADRAVNTSVYAGISALAEKLGSCFNVALITLPCTTLALAEARRLYILANDLLTPDMAALIAKSPGPVLMVSLLSLADDPYSSTQAPWHKSPGGQFQDALARLDAKSSGSPRPRVTPYRPLESVARLLHDNSPYPVFVDRRFMPKLVATPLANLVTPLDLITLSREGFSLQKDPDVIKGAPLSRDDLFDPAPLIAAAKGCIALHHGPRLSDPAYIQVAGPTAQEQQLAIAFAKRHSGSLVASTGQRITLAPDLAHALLETKPSAVLRRNFTPTEGKTESLAQAYEKCQVDIAIGAPPGPAVLSQLNAERAPPTRILGNDCVGALSARCGLEASLLPARFGAFGYVFDDDGSEVLLQRVACLHKGGDNLVGFGLGTARRSVILHGAVDFHPQLGSMRPNRWSFDQGLGLMLLGDRVRGWAKFHLLAGGAHSVSIQHQNGAIVTLALPDRLVKIAHGGEGTLIVDHHGLASFGLVWDPSYETMPEIAITGFWSTDKSRNGKP